MPCILVAEDDTDLRSMLRLLLEKEGFTVLPAADGAQALLLASRQQPDLVLLDVMMPHVNGWEVLAELRRTCKVPVMMLTALGQAADRVRGLELGADDYLTKPFYPPELLLRVHSLLRRAPCSPRKEVLQYPGLTIDLAGERVNGEVLPAREFALLTVLASEPGRVFTRAELGERVWGQQAGFDASTLHTHIKRLRTRLEGGGFRYLHTVWGVGYRFAPEPAPHRTDSFTLSNLP